MPSHPTSICKDCPNVSRSPRICLYAFIGKGDDDANGHNILQIGMVRRTVGCEANLEKKFGTVKGWAKRVRNIFPVSEGQIFEALSKS